MAKEDVACIQPARDAIEPPSLREVTNRPLGGAKRLYRLRRELNVSKQIDLRDLSQPNLLFQRIAIFDLDDLTGFAPAEALRIQVKGTKVVTGRYQLPDVPRRALRILAKQGYLYRTTFVES